MLGVGLPLAPFGLLARRSARPFAIRGCLARLGCSLGSLVGHCRGRCRCRPARPFDLMLDRRRIGQGGKRALCCAYRFCRSAQYGLQISLPLGEARPLPFDPFQCRRRSIDCSRRFPRIALRRQRRSAGCLGFLAATVHIAKHSVAFGRRRFDCAFKCRKLCRQLRAAVGAQQPLGCGRS